MSDATTSASLLKATKQVGSEGLNIPLIDITPLISTTATTQDRANTGKAILDAFVESGFLYLSALPIPVPVLTSVFAHSAAFFARPQEQKDGLAWYSARANRGYSTLGREKVSQGMTVDAVAAERGQNPDLKESMEVGREGEEGCPNMWPDNLDEEGVKFRAAMTDFFARCKDMHAVIMRAIALGLGFDESHFDDYLRVGDNTLRLLHYPPVAAEVFRRNAGAVRAGAHTDYGSITLLFQDTRGGLQVQKGDGEWVDVKPIEGTVVVNAGDLLSRWSNGRIRSTLHRVVNPPLKPGEEEEEDHQGGPDAEYPARYSIAYFCNPDFHKLIEALPGTWEQTGKKWPAVNSGEYLLQRLQATY